MVRGDSVGRNRNQPRKEHQRDGHRKFHAFTDERFTDPITGQQSAKSMLSILNRREKLTRLEMDSVFMPEEMLVAPR